MYLAVVAILGCMALTLAEETCGPLQRIHVQRQWARVYGNGDNRQKFATLVWKDFFRRHEEEKARFANVNGDNIYSNEFRAHMVRVFSGFDLLIGTLNNEAVFQSALAHYTKMHTDLGVKTAIVKEFGKSLGYVLPRFLKGDFALDAWRPCYQLIAAGVSQVSNEVMPEEKTAMQEDKAADENEVEA